MMAAETVRIEWDDSGVAEVFTSDAMRDFVLKAAEEIASETEGRNRAFLKGKVPAGGLYGAKAKKLSRTWIGIVHPKNRAGFSIALKHGFKN